jgi:hypothetical protein
MKIIVPSNKIWIAVGVSFFLIQVFIIIFYKIPKNDGPYDLPISSQLYDIKSDFINKNKSTYNVIFIGNSLVGCGVECPDEIANILANYPTKNILLKKIWKPNDPFEYLIKEKNLINELLQIKPDLICIQSELAAINYKEKEAEHFTLENFEYYSHILSMENKTIINDLTGNETANYNKCAANAFNFKPIKDTLHYIPQTRSVKKRGEIEFAFGGLYKLTKAGVKIVIVDIPRPMMVEKTAYSNHFKQDLNLLFDMYRQKFGIEHWTYTERPMYFKDFYDGGHLKAEGRHLYTKNLLEKIITETATRK